MGRTSVVGRTAILIATLGAGVLVLRSVTGVARAPDPVARQPRLRPAGRAGRLAP
jgi:hypothetical protein